MAKISSAGNSDTAAYAVLWRRGFELRAVKPGEGGPALPAQKERDEFIGANALEVLGLVTLFQVRGENWKPTDEEVRRRTQFEKDPR